MCHDKFGLRNSDLFDPFDLFDVRDFGKVRVTPELLGSDGSGTAGTGVVLQTCAADFG